MPSQTIHVHEGLGPCLLEVLLRPVVEVAQRLNLHLHSPQPLALHLRDSSDGILNLLLDGGNLATRVQSRVGTECEPHVGEPVDGDGEVSFRVVGPAVREQFAVTTSDGEGIAPSRVVARCTDEDVKRYVPTIG